VLLTEKNEFATTALTDINEKGKIDKIIKKLFDPYDFDFKTILSAQR
jgi:hypothetical protein